MTLRYIMTDDSLSEKVESEKPFSTELQGRLSVFQALQSQMLIPEKETIGTNNSNLSPK